MKRTVIAMISMSLVSACLGCAEPEPRPTPPDLSGLVAAYAAPSGEVTRESALRLVEEDASALALVDDADAFVGLIQTMFTDLGGVLADEKGLSVQQSGLTVSGVDLDAGGWIVYHRFCPTANGAGARGTIKATALIDIDAFEPVIWGALNDCRVDGAGLDGALALHIEWIDGVPAGVIGRIDGVVNLGGTVKDGEFSVRWQGDTVMTRVVLDDRDGFLVGVDSGSEELLIEGRNGRFVCDTAGCTGPDEGFAW